MVKQNTILTMVGILLTIVFHISSSAQIHDEYPRLEKYSKWSVNFGPTLYNKAEITPQYGEYSFTNKPIPSFTAGFEYDFYPERKWSVITGFLIAKEPIYNISYTIYNNDLLPGSNGDLTNKTKGYSLMTFSSPLMLRLNIQSSSKTYLSFLTGLKVMYFPKGSASFAQIISDEDTSESLEIFGLNLHSQEFSFYGSYIIGTGFILALDKVLLKTNLIYVMNFHNTLEGEYQFGNLFESQPTRGNYELSGNYLSLSLSISIKKHKKI
jgi:hypothetical protein